ncbi:MAG: ATP-dependent 6-phosphofructokinase [Deltaproteobacteria bacterium]|jgi:6-phosphofructokinase 1|nr:ATP-dependent 6-phosphofructokinase [Deltaproteobacteria bacterium]
MSKATQRHGQAHDELNIESLGPTKIDSPLLAKRGAPKDGNPSEAIAWEAFTDDSQRVLKDATLASLAKFQEEGAVPACFEEAGARRKIYFDPSKSRAGILTAGGLCPGLNDVIRSLVMTLFYRYGVQNILGVKYGYQGLIPSYGHSLMQLTPASVAEIHQFGGTVLGSSRGNQSIEELVDSLERLNMNILFCIGGDGTLKGANMVAEEIKNRGLKIAIVGIPKTIDNDIGLVSRSFGFETAVAVATEVIRSAHTEALGAPGGVGLVKLMGRDSGFIASTAALARGDANFVLIPEIDFDVDGPGALLERLYWRIKNRGHAVIVVAEGAGQKFFAGEAQTTDASGNVLHKDIGQYLAERIKNFFKDKDLELNLKYLDPSYIIRSAPANSTDQVFCSFLGQKAAHAAMAGKTNCLVGQWNDHFVHVPIAMAIKARKKVDPMGELWNSVLERTGQPSLKAGEA